MIEPMATILQRYGLRPSEYRAIIVINEYLQATGRNGFTYRGLRAYWSRKGMFRDPGEPLREWHTFERVIRRLAEKGYLDRRIYRKNRRQFVVFFPSPLFDEVVEERRGLLDDG